MNLGETVSFIRESKNIKVKQLCGNKFSRSTYTRFINNETDISMTNFFFAR